MDSQNFSAHGCLTSEAGFFVIATGRPAGPPQRFFAVADDTTHRAVTQRHRQHDECTWNAAGL